VREGVGGVAERVADATLGAVTTLPVVLRPGESGWIVVECPVLVGCVSQGRTREEALANIREAIELCLEAGDRPAGELVDVTVAA
jgi:predicted RNase H-like HicB family nuclease